MSRRLLRASFYYGSTARSGEAWLRYAAEPRSAASFESVPSFDQYDLKPRLDDSVFEAYEAAPSPRFLSLSFQHVHDACCDAPQEMTAANFEKAVRELSLEFERFYRRLVGPNTLRMVFSDHGMRVRKQIDPDWDWESQPELEPTTGVYVTDNTIRTFTGLVHPELFPARKIHDQIRSIDIVPDHPTLIVRMCRVVDEEKPRRDSALRAEILRQQERIAASAAMVAVNDELNARRWRRFYGDRQEVLLVPGASPERIPKPHTNPFHPGHRIVLFCGSLTSPRFPGVINSVAKALGQIDPSIEVHVIGRNRLHLYGGNPEPLDRRVVCVHDPVDATRYGR